MSPARARTSTSDVLTAGRALLETGGLDAVTMLAVAARVGVKAPSLYKRFPSRAALIAAMCAAGFDDLRRSIEPAAAHPDPSASLRAVAEAYRAFAHAHPRTYELMHMSLPPEAQPPLERNALAAAPLLSVVERLVGADRTLEAARLVTAFAHGFVSMELNGAFRLGGDVDAAYRYGVDVLAEALSSRRPRSTT